MWSDAGDGSGVTQIIPAVPSSSGVADVFAFQASGNVQAVTSTGKVGWTANLSSGYNLPDFQGGLVNVTRASVQKLEGLTGNPQSVYTYSDQISYHPALVHTDGTIFTVDGNSIVAVNPLTNSSRSYGLAQSVGSTSGNCGEFHPHPII